LSRSFNRDTKRVEKARLNTMYQKMQEGQSLDPKSMCVVACSQCGASKVTLTRVSERCVKPVVYACETCQDEGLRGVGGRLGRIKKMAHTLQLKPSLLDDKEVVIE